MYTALAAFHGPYGDQKSSKHKIFLNNINWDSGGWGGREREMILTYISLELDSGEFSCRDVGPAIETVHRAVVEGTMSR